MATSQMRSEDPRWQLEPATAAAQWLLFALTVALPLGIVLAVPGVGGRAEATIAEFAGGNPVLLKVYAGAVALAVFAGIFVLLWMMMRRHRLAMDAAGVEVTTSFYRRRLAWPELKLAEARVVSLAERTELKPALKSHGYAMPGFRSGWFRTRKLGKLFVATAGGDRVLWVPTTKGYDLLLQPRNPQAALQRMQELAEMAPASHGR